MNKAASVAKALDAAFFVFLWAEKRVLFRNLLRRGKLHMIGLACTDDFAEVSSKSLMAAFCGRMHRPHPLPVLPRGTWAQAAGSSGTGHLRHEGEFPRRPPPLFLRTLRNHPAEFLRPLPVSSTAAARPALRTEAKRKGALRPRRPHNNRDRSHLLL